MSVPSRESSAASALESPSGPTGRETSGLCPLRKIPGGNLCLGARYGPEVGETGSSRAAKFLSQAVG